MLAREILWTFSDTGEWFPRSKILERQTDRRTDRPDSKLAFIASKKKSVFLSKQNLYTLMSIIKWGVGGCLIKVIWGKFWKIIGQKQRFTLQEGQHFWQFLQNGLGVLLWIWEYVGLCLIFWTTLPPPPAGNHQMIPLIIHYLIGP